MAEFTHLFKLLLVGDSNTGKSSLLIRYADDQFSESYISTIGVDFRVRTIKHDGVVAKLQIWDTAGQERFSAMTTTYYRGSHGIIITYDTTNAESFKNVRKWLHECKQFARGDPSILICGTKTDLRDSRSVTLAQVEAFAEEHDTLWIETSAKESHNIDLAFLKLTTKIIQTQPTIGASQKRTLTTPPPQSVCCS